MMLRIAVQSKGRLNDETMALLTEAGIRLESGKRTLLVPARGFPVEILFLRDDDIPQAVADGVADVGVVGENEYAERKKMVKIVKRLGFSKCRLSLAIPKDEEYSGLEWFNGKTIATSYPVILQEYLASRNIKAETHVISGSVEIAPGIGLADAIFDIVSSGSTLVSNRLKEVEVLMKSEALLIGHPNLNAEKSAILDEVIFRINAVQTAYGKKYILLNAPNHKIDEIIQVLPGMNSPSILPLAQEGWSSLHSVIDEDRFWEIIGMLKALGAEGILVIPIEKMIVQQVPIRYRDYPHKGKEFEQPTVSGRDWVNINGMINAKNVTDVIALDCDSVNAESAKELYQKALEKYPEASKICIISDNARYYKNKELKEWIKDTKIIQLFLPPCSPNLNMIERLWRFLRKKVINTVLSDKRIIQVSYLKFH